MELSYENIVELFVHVVVPAINDDDCVPRINFIFPDRQYFDKFISDDNSLINQRDVNRLFKFDDNSLSINIPDAEYFFQLLFEFNKYNLLFRRKYDDDINERLLFIYGIRYLWLRMNANDVANINDFLERQIAFLKNELSDNMINDISLDYLNNRVECRTIYSMSYDEAATFMEIALERDREIYQLPVVYFGIDKDTAYIYAIQSKNIKDNSKKINRDVYKLNKGIKSLESQEYLDYLEGSEYYPENISDVSPSSVLALLIFIQILLENGIKKIRVPLLQVLSYDYHRILSANYKEEFERKWSKKDLEGIQMLPPIARARMQRKYERDLTWYRHIVDKFDFISKAKTENFIRVFRRVEEQFGYIKILNDPFVEDDCLNIQILSDIKELKVRK